MTKNRHNIEQIKKAILGSMMRRHIIGMKYKPKKFIISKLAPNARGEINNLLNELFRDGFIEYHKNKNCISLNPKNKKEICNYTKNHVSEYSWKNFCAEK